MTENKKRLIYADDLYEKIKEASKDAGYYRPIYEGFLNAINRTPTVNSVIYAYWEWRGKDRGYFCSNCHSGCLLNYESDWHKSDYCPHCGAKMDLEE